MGGAPGQGFGQQGGGYGGMGGQAPMGGQGGGLAGLGAPGGGQGGGLSALSAANPQLAALAGSYMSNQQPSGGPPQGGGQRPQSFDSLSKPKSDSGHGSAPGSAAGAPTAEVEWAEPFAGKGKKEPPFPLKLHQVRTLGDV